MSGDLGVVAGDLASLLSQPAPLIIGTLILQGYEVPSHITIGGSQAITMHKLPGGGRILDAMGPDDGSVAWRGLFIGPGAAQRARSLDIMRTQGLPQVLSFGDYTFKVVIVHYEYDYQERGAIINYRIRMEIVSDPASLIAAVPGIDVALQDDLNTSYALITASAAAATTYITLVGKLDAAQLTAAAYNLTTISAGVGMMMAEAAVATSSTLASDDVVQIGLQDVGTSMKSGIDALSTYFTASTSLTSFTTASTLASATAQAASLAGLVQAGGYINRSRASIASASAQSVAPVIHA